MLRNLFRRLTSRKFLVTAGSNVVSGYLLTRGVDVSPAEVQQIGAAVVESGDILDLGVVIGQAWVNKKYVESQAQVDAVAVGEDLSELKEIVFGDDPAGIPEGIDQ